MINTAILRRESIDSIRHTVVVLLLLIILALVIADVILYVQNIPYIPKVITVSATCFMGRNLRLSKPSDIE